MAAAVATFFVGAAGEGRQPQAGAPLRQREPGEPISERWLLVSTTLLVALQALGYTHLFFVVFDLVVLAVGGADRLQLTPAVRAFYAAAPLLNPASTILLFYIYNSLERQAFEEFEEMFPPDADGMGDAKRFMPPLRRRHPRRRKTPLWLTVVQLCFLLVVLRDLNEALGYLGHRYATTEHHLAKLAVLVALMVVNRFCHVVPVALFVSLIADSYSHVLPFGYVRPEPSPTALARLALGVVALAFWRYRLRKRRGLFVPDVVTTLRLLIGHLGQDVDMLLLGQLAMLMRWMRLTGQAERHFVEEGVQVQLLIAPAANQNMQDGDLENIIFGINDL